MLPYYQSIYTHCKQRFNIPDGIEVVKKSVYQYIKNCINNYLFGNYNISEVRSNLYNNLVHYSQLGTEDLNKLNFNIIEYCKEKYPVQSKYSFDFKSETETSNKGKQRLKQYLRTTPNTSILQKTTAKHLQTPEQGTSVKLPLSITLFPISLENESNYSESLESKETESKPEEITENKEEMATAYIAKIPEFTAGLKDKLIKKVCPHAPADLATAIRHTKSYEMAMEEANHTKLNTSITLRNRFRNIKQETSESFIAGLKDKLIKKVCPHAPADLATAIRHTKSYEMAMEEANHTKLVNLAIGETSSAAEKKINQLTKKKAITAMYTEATVEEKPIRLILDSGSAGNIITYQLIQQLK
ncbi:hypothetical protein G9A89_023158 [Geosiphon pyriformis]|nr:hypothetical protein G9A89_023158 [Geosiphon pyriformis]